MRSADDTARVLFAEAARRHRAGEAAEAERLYRQVLAIAPDHAESLHRLGVLAYQAGRSAEAAALIARAIERRPDVAAYHNNLGLTLQAQGERAAAAAAFARALSLRPDFSLGHNNLGVLALEEKRIDEAVAHFSRALAAEPTYLAARINLGTALTEAGKLAAAVAELEHALSLAPLSADAHYNRGVALMWQGRIEEAFAAYRRSAELRAADPTTASRTAPAYKAKHDREQADYLRAAHPETALISPLHIEGGARCTAAINPALDRDAIEARWETGRPQIAVVDDLLSPAALDELRRFCWGSMIWRKPHPNGYLGAFFADGFASPLLAQIAEELGSRLPRVIRNRPLRQAWGFKYDSECQGIAVHADEAAVNVNFWITADEANLDPEGGGLVIWDVPAPLDWAFARYQNNDSTDIRAFLAARRARSIRVPHRANRAVIFDSDLFHETDRFRFREGYENRRINITMLYGSRHDPGAG